MACPTRTCVCPAVATFLLCAVCATTAQSQNLVSNGGFDLGTLAPWQVTEPGYVVWSGFDHAGSGTSGSAVLVNDDAGGNTLHSPLRQCIVLDRPAHVFRLRFAGYVEVGQPDGFIGVSIGFGTPAISQCDVPHSGIGTGIGDPSGEWEIRDRAFVLPYTLPAGSEIEVVFMVIKDQAGGSFYGYLDDIVVENDSLIRDGFDPPWSPESGSKPR